MLVADEVVQIAAEAVDVGVLAEDLRARHGVPGDVEGRHEAGAAVCGLHRVQSAGAGEAQRHACCEIGAAWGETPGADDCLD